MAFRLDRRDGLTVVRCDAMERVAGTQHAFSTRLGPTGDRFDLAGEAEDSALLMQAAGLAGVSPFLLRQVHGNRVVDAGAPAAGSPPEADASVAFAPAIAPAVRYADCVPILIADRRGRAVAAVHSGWRGTALDVAGRAVARLQAAGIGSRDLVAALGPAIGPCCYEVGPEVIEQVKESKAPAGRLDLRQAIAAQLARAGLPAGAIHAAPWCTACSGEWFFSHRREGPPAGRMMATIGLTAGRG